jgi:hypothetical protein
LRINAAAERAAKDKGSGAFLFPCETDATRPLPGIQSPHARALRESKVARFRPYDCRHTWATRAVEAGIDLVTLAAMLGHSKINMVLRYAHPTQEHQTKAMDKMESSMSANRRSPTRSEQRHKCLMQFNRGGAEQRAQKSAAPQQYPVQGF